MKPHKRGFAESNFAILYVLGRDGPLKSTHLMYRVNVNSKILKEYTGLLMDGGYIRFDKRLFSLTNKGVMFVHFAQEFFMLQKKAVIAQSEVLVK